MLGWLVYTMNFYRERVIGMNRLRKNMGSWFGLGRSVLVVAVLLGLASAAVGQVRQYTGKRGYGNALDASPMVGSSGYNTATGANDPYNLGQMRTQLMMQNQTTGLSSFHGRLGYYAPNQLNLNLPSRQMDTFRQQSVGVQDVLRGPTYTANPYFARSSSTLSPRAIAVQEASGQVVMPNLGRTPAAQQATQKLYRSATQDYSPIMPAGPINALLGNALSTQKPKLGKVTVGSQDTQAQGAQAAARADRGLFALPHLQDRARLAHEIGQYDEDQPLDSNVIQPIGQAAELKLKSQRITPIGTSLDKTSPASQKPGTQAGVGAKKDKSVASSALPSAAIHKSYLPDKNQDAFMDMLVQLRQKNQLAATAKPGSPQTAAPGKLTGQTQQRPPIGQNTVSVNPPAVGPDDRGITPPGMTTPGKLPQADQPAKPAAQGGIVGFTSDNRVILRSLAGEGGDLFNRYMSLAKKELDAGRFYEAAQYYDLAAGAKPTNPLAPLGMCLAKFAAEEWYASAESLRRAVELFPPLMETKLDLTKLMPLKNLNDRLDSLELWATKVHDKPVLVFLAAFMQQNAGRGKLAKKHAENLKKSEYATPIMKAYANYLLTGKLPAELQRAEEAAIK